VIFFGENPHIKDMCIDMISCVILSENGIIYGIGQGHTFPYKDYNRTRGVLFGTPRKIDFEAIEAIIYHDIRFTILFTKKNELILFRNGLYGSGDLNMSIMTQYMPQEFENVYKMKLESYPLSSKIKKIVPTKNDAVLLYENGRMYTCSSIINLCDWVFRMENVSDIEVNNHLFIIQNSHFTLFNSRTIDFCDIVFQ
jgi:alpha-tubulin suppressor-like RCC1 family protein